MRPARTARVLPLMLAVAITLAGCGSTPALDRDTAADLQSGVLAVTTAAAAGDFSTAADTLRTVTEQAEEAAAAGRISTERYRSISAALRVVDDDLQDAITAAQLQQLKDDLAKQAADTLAAQQAAADLAAQQQAAADLAAQQAAEQQADDAPTGPGGPGGGEDDSGPGKGKGPGKDK